MLLFMFLFVLLNQLCFLILPLISGNFLMCMSNIVQRRRATSYKKLSLKFVNIRFLITKWFSFGIIFLRLFVNFPIGFHFLAYPNLFGIKGFVVVVVVVVFVNLIFGSKSTIQLCWNII
jgi:hypothetical protein